MRAWPPIQILLILLLLGGAAWTLRYVGGAENGRDVPIAEANSTREMASVVDLRIQGTEPFRIEELRWGSTVIKNPLESRPSWSTRFSSTEEGPLFIGGDMKDGNTPAALQVEIDRHGSPAFEKILWIRTNPFHLVIPFESE